jgi:alpha-glucosidase
MYHNILMVFFWVARVMMVEAYTNITNTMKYYGTATRAGAHFPFNFGIINNVNNDTNAAGLKGVIDEWFAYLPDGAWANWVVRISIDSD